MKKCKNCEEKYEDHLDICPTCGLSLEKAEEDKSEVRRKEGEKKEPEPLEEERKKVKEENLEEGEEKESLEEEKAEEDEKKEKLEEEKPEEGEEKESLEEEKAEEDEEERKKDEEEDVECPYCGEQNPSGAKFCQDCGNKLKIEDEEMIRCQNCGSKNLPEAENCEQCGKPLTLERRPELIKIRFSPPSGQTRTLLEVRDTRKEFGREDLIRVLPHDQLKYITRKDNEAKPEKKQFEIIPEEGKYYIIDENSVNGTWVNGENIKGKGEKELKEGDEIRPADEVTFEVATE